MKECVRVKWKMCLGNGSRFEDIYESDIVYSSSTHQVTDA